MSGLCPRAQETGHGRYSQGQDRRRHRRGIGIGHAIAIAAARHGAKAVIVSDITETPRDGVNPPDEGVGKVGSIVLMASMGGLVGADITVAYSTSKGGVVLMTKALAGALGSDGIPVNAVAPGTIDTELLRSTPDIAAASEGFRQRTPLRRFGQPSEIGDAADLWRPARYPVLKPMRPRTAGAPPSFRYWPPPHDLPLRRTAAEAADARGA
jgi:NAD(P)-dependent dehydrogenase (short-subunit alcohol dehydrogenase family)